MLGCLQLGLRAGESRFGCAQRLLRRRSFAGLFRSRELRILELPRGNIGLHGLLAGQCLQPARWVSAGLSAGCREHGWLCDFNRRDIVPHQDHAQAKL